MITPGRALLLLTLAASTASAATTVTQNVEPQQVGTEDVAQVTVEVTDAKGVATVNLQATDDFEILGQSSSTSTRVQLGMGPGPSVQRSQRFSFSIRANRTGTFQIPAAAISVDGEQLKGEPLQLEVRAGHVASARAPTDPFASMFGSDPFGDNPFDDFFNRPRAIDAQLITSVDQSKVYQGEQTVVSFYLATRSELTSVGGFKLPTIDGASAHDLEIGKKLTARSMTIDGKEYQAYLVARRVLFPTRPGTLEIPEASVEVHGRVLKSRARTLEVRALPPGGEPGEPVGSWRLTTQTTGQPQVGQPIPVQVIVEGTGDLGAIPEPRLAIDGARVLPPAVKDSSAYSNGKLGGQRTFEFLVMPDKPGTLTVPPVQLAFFDPATARHEQARSEPLTLQVAGSPALAQDPPQAPGPSAPATAPEAQQSPRFSSRAVVPAVAILVGLILAGFLVPPLSRRLRRWAVERAERAPSRAAFRRQASSALARARTDARAGRATEAIRLAEQALFDTVRSAGLQPEQLDADALARDSSRPFLSGWAQALLECRRARFMRLDPEKVDTILTRAARTLDEAPRRETPSIPSGPGVPATFAR